MVSTECGVLSPEVRRSVPDKFRWDLSANGPGEVRAANQIKPQRRVPGEHNAPATSSSREATLSQEELIARAIVRYMLAGTFRASDAEKTVQKHLPGIPVPSSQAWFAQYLLDEVSPVLETLGVEVNSKQKSSKRYKVTEESKRRI